MVKGQCQKAETLNDGSIKLSIYFNKEDINNVFPLAYKEVYISETLPPETESEQYQAIKKEVIKSVHETIVKYCEEQLKGDL